MAQKNATSVRFDDFVAAVHADPANVEPMRLLSGFVGKSDADGRIRIYPEPSLCHWIEAAVEDVVHSAPIPDSPLGGSHVWLKAAAQIKPGAAGAETAAPAAPAGGIGVEAGVFSPFAAVGGLGGIFTGGAWCPTRSFPCGPGNYSAFPCLPVHSFHDICIPTEIGCPPTSTPRCPPHDWRTRTPFACLATDPGGPCLASAACPPPPPTVSPVVCAQSAVVACPLTVNCAIDRAAFAAAPSPTDSTRCFFCGPTETGGCGQFAQAPQAAVLPTAAGCQLGPTGFQGCVVDPTAATRCFICPPIGPTGFQGCGPYGNPTAATRCFICPPIG